MSTKIERIGKSERVYSVFELNNFTGMTFEKIQESTRLPKHDLEIFFEKHSATGQKEDKYVCKDGLYYLLAECR